MTLPPRSDTTSPAMHLRPFTREDLPGGATVLCDAFYDNVFFAWLAPGRGKYPEAWRRWTVNRTRRRLLEPGTWAIACVETSSTGEEEILGIAFWNRQASIHYPFPPSKYLCNNQDIFTKFEMMLWSIEERYRSLVGNPATNAEALRKISGPPTADGFAEIPDRWYLAVAAVSPKHQRRGVGQMLLQWGLDRCKEEGKSQADGKSLQAGLIASAEGQKLYAKLGFKVTMWHGLGSEDDGGAAMIWDPDNTWIRPLTEKDGVVLKGGRPVEVIYKNTEDEEAVEKQPEADKGGSTRPSKKVVFLEEERAAEGTDAPAIRDMAM